MRKKSSGSRSDSWVDLVFWIISIIVIIFWLIILILFIHSLRADYHIRWISIIAFVALLISFIFLGELVEMHIPERGKKIYFGSKDQTIISMLFLITVIVLVVYIIWKVFTDRESSDQITWWESFK